MPGVIAALPVAVVIVYTLTPPHDVGGGNTVYRLIGHVGRERAVEQIKLRIAVVAAQLKAIEAFEAAILQNSFRIFMAGAVVPNCGYAGMCNQLAALGIS